MSNLKEPNGHYERGDEETQIERAVWKAHLQNKGKREETPKTKDRRRERNDLGFSLAEWTNATNSWI